VCGQLGKTLDVLYPENGYHRKLRSIAARPKADSETLGPHTLHLLARLVLREEKPAVNTRRATTPNLTDAGFSWEYSGRMLKLRWTRLMWVRLTMSSTMEVEVSHLILFSHVI
jgi:hypothetical protein